MCKHYCAIKQMISSESGILGIVQEYDDEMSSEDVHGGGGGPSVLKGVQLFNSLTAVGKKEFLNLVVLHLTLLNLRPEGRSVKSPCWG